jgi:PAS domain S-box-containing protein
LPDFASEARERKASLGKKTILLVEDEAIIALAEARRIEHFGFGVLRAGCGEEAVGLCLSRRDIDLVLMDIDLGRGIDGTEAAARILADRALPIVFLTSHSERGTVEKVRGITRYGYVVKNSGDFVLLSSIEMAFELFEAQRRSLESEESLSTTLNSIGDAVIATDTGGRVTRMNPSAEKLTGWSLGEAAGLPLKQVFRIINEATRGSVDDPVEKVLASGHIMGLANHTILLSRDGSEYQIADSAAPIRDRKGSVQGVILVFSDVTARHRTEAALRESEERYRAAFLTSPDSVNINTMSGTYVDINEGFTRILGYSREDVIGRLSSEIGIWAIPGDREKLVRGLRESGSVENLESLFRHKDGRLVHGLMSARILMVGSLPHILSITKDVSEQVSAQAKIGDLLREKELLLKEVHHRLKNNLMSIASLLSLQADTSGQAPVAAALLEAAGRVRSIQIIYDRLYRSEDFKHVPSEEYFGELLDDINVAFSAAAEVSVGVSVDHALLDADQLFPLGIIVNELMTNAYKYAFCGGRRGRIDFSFSRTAPAEYELCVADDGPGLPAGMDVEKSTGFGLQLVSALTAQLGGRLELSRPGARVRIRFPGPSEASSAPV